MRNVSLAQMGVGLARLSNASLNIQQYRIAAYASCGFSASDMCWTDELAYRRRTQAPRDAEAPRLHNSPTSSGDLDLPPPGRVTSHRNSPALRSSQKVPRGGLRAFAGNHCRSASSPIEALRPRSAGSAICRLRTFRLPTTKPDRRSRSCSVRFSRLSSTDGRSLQKPGASNRR